MKRLRLASLIITGIISLFGISLAAAQPALAQNPHEKSICEGSGGEWDPGANGGTCRTPGSVRTVPNTIRRVVTILIFIVGAVSILMIVVGGLRYVLSGGDEKAVAAAKNTIIFAIVGVVIAVAAYAIVNFVLTNLGIN